MNLPHCSHLGGIWPITTPFVPPSPAPHSPSDQDPEVSPLLSSPQSDIPTCDIEVPPHSPSQLLLEQGQGGFHVICSSNGSSSACNRLFEISQQLCRGQGVILQVLLYAARENETKSAGLKRGRAKSPAGCTPKCWCWGFDWTAGAHPAAPPAGRGGGNEMIKKMVGSK